MNEKNLSCTKQIEQTFTTNPLAAQWFIQKEKAISESLDNKASIRKVIIMKEFNESKFTNYLSSLINDFNNPTTEYDKGAFETLKRIINEFEADHYDQD